MCQRRSVGAGSVFERAGVWTLVSLSIFASSIAMAQAPPPPGGLSNPPARGTAPASGASNPRGSDLPQVSDLTTRFRFTEHYTTADTKSRPSDIGTYQVGAKVIHRIVTEQEQGASERFEGTTSIVFTERPTVINISGLVTDTVRRYERFEVSILRGRSLSPISRSTD